MKLHNKDGLMTTLQKLHRPFGGYAVAGGRRRKDTQTDRRKARLYRHACEICRAGVRAALRTGQADGNRGILIA